MAIPILFFGTSDFAVPTLNALANDGRFEIAGVVTQPDRPTGRHAILTKPPVKIAAEVLGLSIFQFEKVKSDDALEQLKALRVDVGVVVSFGQIIPQRILDLPKHGMVNVHGSLLPKFRGASPIQAAICEGEKETGVTIMKVDALLDHGPTLAFATEPIRSDDTGGSLHDRLAELGARTLPNVLFDYVAGALLPVEQNHAKATAVNLLTRENGLLDFSKPAKELERMVRAYDPWPGTYFLIDGRRLKVLRADVGTRVFNPARSCVIEAGKPAMVCSDGVALKFLRVQPEGKSAMDGDAYLRGRAEWN